MDITVCGESLWANMRHSANVSYLTIYFYFGACVSECALFMCLCVCCRFVVVAVFYLSLEEHFYFAYHPHLLDFSIYIYVFCSVFFIHLIQLKSQHFCFTILEPFSPLYSLASKWIGRLLFLLLLLFFIFCFFRSRIFHLKTIQPERLCVTLLCSFIKRNRVWWRGIFNEKNEPTKRRFSAHKHFQNPHTQSMKNRAVHEWFSLNLPMCLDVCDDCALVCGRSTTWFFCHSIDSFSQAPQHKRAKGDLW